MAATVSVIWRDVTRTVWQVYANVTGDSSYPNTGTYSTSGYLISASQLGIGGTATVAVFLGASFEGLGSSGALGYVTQFDVVNSRLHFLLSAGFTPAGTISAPTITTVTNATTTAPVFTAAGALTQTTGATGITGVQAPTFTGTAVVAGKAVEVANAVNLTTVTVRMRFDAQSG